MEKGLVDKVFTVWMLVTWVVNPHCLSQLTKGVLCDAAQCQRVIDRNLKVDTPLLNFGTTCTLLLWKTLQETDNMPKRNRYYILFELTRIAL